MSEKGKINNLIDYPQFSGKRTRAFIKKEAACNNDSL